jgi:hypothetical protein
MNAQGGDQFHVHVLNLVVKVLLFDQQTEASNRKLMRERTLMLCSTNSSPERNLLGSFTTWYHWIHRSDKLHITYRLG